MVPNVRPRRASKEATAKPQDDAAGFSASITLESLVIELDAAAALARDKGSVAALVDIVLAKAKLIGLLVDRTDSTNRNVYAVSSEPLEQQAWASKHASPPPPQDGKSDSGGVEPEDRLAPATRTATRVR